MIHIFTLWFPAPKFQKQAGGQLPEMLTIMFVSWRKIGYPKEDMPALPHQLWPKQWQQCQPEMGAYELSSKSRVQRIP